MKAFISVDLEGLPGVSSPRHLYSREAMHGEARKLATRVVSKISEYLKEYEFEEVRVADSHGGMVNLLLEELPDYVTLISGSPRPYSMVYGVKGCDAAIFVGYHARAGTQLSVFSHTYSGASVYELRINGLPSSEFYLNALAAGHFNVPVILVGGEKALRDEVAERAPWAEFVVLKESASYYASVNYPLPRVYKELKAAVKRAVEKLKEGKALPLKVEGRVRMEIDLKSPGLADVASLIPGVERVNGYTVAFESDNIIDCYKVLQAVSLMSAGVAKLQEIL